MRRYRRPPRRQGVVYGPAFGSGPSHGPSLAGRITGALLVVGALALMAGVTYAFLGRDRGPTAVVPSPTPTDPLASPDPVVSPSPPLPGPSPSPLAPTPGLTLPPTPEPEATPFVVEVREGPGAITFGSDYDDDLQLVDRRTTFPPRGQFAWSAELIEPAGASELTIQVSEYDPEEGTETVVHTETQRIRNQSTSRLLRRMRMQRLVDDPGIYVVRYLRGEQVLSEGWLRVEDD